LFRRSGANATHARYRKNSVKKSPLTGTNSHTDLVMISVEAPHPTYIQMEPSLGTGWLFGGIHV